jgi:hypothetical protein
MNILEIQAVLNGNARNFYVKMIRNALVIKRRIQGDVQSLL